MIWKKKKTATADKAAKAADVERLKKENQELSKKLDTLNASMLELMDADGEGNA